MKKIGSLLIDRVKKLEKLRDTNQGDIETKEQYSCSICQDRGIILEGEQAKPCLCMRQKALLKRFKNAHVSRKLLQYTFEDFQLNYYAADKIDKVTGVSYRETANNALAAAKNFVSEALVKSEGDGLLYTGPVGCGKTFISGCIANALMEGGREVLFIVVPDLLDEIKATYDQNRLSVEITEQHIMETARNVEILILDDLGAHNYTDWTRNKLYSIINHRLNQQLRTVVTTNLGLKELEEYIGERSTSRLIQMCQIRRLAVANDIRYLKHDEKNRNK